jgi:hypothetical protein
MWICEKCKEEIEDNFDACWNCSGEGSVLKNNESLSKKYTVLKTYKALAFLLMLVATASYIYSFTSFLPESPITYILPTISFIISIFSLYCLTKMIDFLFDLDSK